MERQEAEPVLIKFGKYTFFFTFFLIRTVAATIVTIITIRQIKATLNNLIAEAHVKLVKTNY